MYLIVLNILNVFCYCTKNNLIIQAIRFTKLKEIDFDLKLI